MVPISNNIKRERMRLEWSIEQVADYVGVEAADMQRWENGELDMSIDTLIDLSELFSCSLEYLFRRAEERF